MTTIGLKFLYATVLLVISITIANFYEEIDNSKVMINMSIYLVVSIFLARLLAFIV